MYPQGVGHPGAFFERRSLIPRVIGILAIVFASIGLLFSLAMSFGFDDDLMKHGVTKADLDAYGTWMTVSIVPALAVFAAHLTAGIQCVRYAPSAPTLMIIYASLALARNVADVVITALTFPAPTYTTMFEDLGAGRIGIAMMATPWPIVALVLMMLRTSRKACRPIAPIAKTFD